MSEGCLADPGSRPVMRMAKERRPRRSFMATGHRLGSALATLFEKTVKNKFDISAVCAFASPRVGNTVQSIAADFLAHRQHPGHCSRGSLAPSVLRLSA